jgi:hypothetical protein
MARDITSDLPALGWGEPPAASAARDGLAGAGAPDNIVRDSSREPIVRELEITRRAGIGAYVGVPLVMADGRTYGTFCCLSHEPQPSLRQRDVEFMHVLARLIAD